MVNDRLEEYLADVERNISHIPAAERQAAVREMSSHLYEQVAELRRADTQMGEIEATERALRNFGDPNEIGISYGRGGASHVVNNRTGQVLLGAMRATGRMAAATGRGLGTTLKWVIIGVFAVLLLALGSALTLLIVFQDDIREAAPRPIHSYSQELGSETATRTSNFAVSPDVKEIRIHINVDREGTTGCAAITIRDPRGNIVFDSTDNCSDLRTLLTFYEAGNWTIDYRYTTFNGWLEVDVYAFERAE